MRNYAFGFVISLLLLAFITGCSGSEDTNEPHKSFIWEVTSDTTTIYVLGSVHVASSDIYPLADAIENAYDRSQYLAVEIDMTGLNLWEVQNQMLDRARYPSGDHLQDNIPGELYTQVEKKWKQLGLSSLPLNLDDFEPWFVSQMIADTEMLSMGYGPQNGIDIYFMNKANKDGRDILQFETMQFQLDLLDSMPEDLQVLELEEIINEPPTKKDIERMFEAWENGDSYEMEQIIAEDFKEYPQLIPYSEKILDERNFNMMDRIEGFLQDDEVYFVVVGAGHLVGENGIINLLKEKGYPTEQL